MSIEIYDRDSFFLRIIQEYKDYKEVCRDTAEKIPPCFICSYMERKKSAMIDSVSESTESLETYAQSDKRSKYVLLKAIIKARKNKIISWKQFTVLFSELTGEELSDPKDEDLKIKNRKIIKKQENSFLFGYIDDFFYNKGYSVSKLKKRTKSKKKDDGYVDELDVLCSYFEFQRAEKRNVSIYSSAIDIDENYIQQCSELLKMLIEEDNDEVLVPLYFDSRHGAAVYIIGTYYYDGAIDTDNCCVVMVSHFNVLYSGVYYTDQNDGDIDIGLQCEFFDSVAEAFECLHDGSKSDDFYDDYRANNSIAEPENINSVFQPFFNFDKDRKFKSKMTADREEIGKAYDNNKSAMFS